MSEVLSDGLICAFSGRQPTDDEEALPFDPHHDDPLEDSPIGWTRVTLETRVLNPDWVALQEAKGVQIGLALEQLDGEEVSDEDRARAERIARISVDAVFAALEGETSPYLSEHQALYLSPPGSSDPRIRSAWKQFGKLLGLVGS